MIDIRSIVANTIAIAFIGLLFLFMLTWIIFDFQGSSTSLKDTWTIVSSLFSGIATLAAAYIAANLFNDWRETQTAQNRAEHAKAVKKSLIALKSNMDFYHQQASVYLNQKKLEDRKACKELKEEFLKEYPILFIDLKVNVGVYENTYNEILIENIDGNDLKVYFMCIQIALDNVINIDDDHPHNEAEKILSEIEKFNNSFHQKFFLPILNKLNPHINLVGKQQETI